MVFWLLLKFAPAFAAVSGASSTSRYAVYILLGGLIAGTVYVCLTMRRPDLRPSALPVVLALFFVASIAPKAHVTLAQGSWPETLPTARGVFLFVTLALFALSKGGMRKWFLLFFLMKSAVLLSNLAISWATVTRGVDLGTASYDGQRVTGLYENTWTIAYEAICFLPMGLIMGVNLRSKTARIGALVVATAAIAMMLFSVSRIALLTLPLILAAFALELMLGGTTKLSPLRLRRGLVAAASFLAILCLGVFTNREAVQYYAALWTSRLTEYSPDDSPRWSTIEAGMRIFADKPLTGAGWDAVADLGPDYGSQMSFASPHNLIVDSAAQGGALGLLFGLGLQFGVPIWLLTKTRGAPGFYIYIGAWLAFMVSNTIVSALMLEAHWDLFCFWLLHLAALGRFGPEQDLRAATIGYAAKPRAQELGTQPSRSPS